MLEHRNHPLFAEFAQHFGQFMRSLKGRIKSATAEYGDRP